MYLLKNNSRLTQEEGRCLTVQTADMQHLFVTEHEAPLFSHVREAWILEVHYCRQHYAKTAADHSYEVHGLKYGENWLWIQ